MRGSEVAGMKGLERELREGIRLQKGARDCPQSRQGAGTQAF